MPKRASFRGLLLVSVGLFIVLHVAVAVMRYGNRPDETVVPRGIDAFPKAKGRVGQQIEMLTQESLETSAKRLGDVGMYFWPGPMGDPPSYHYEFPIPRALADRDVDSIMSNRRVLKVFSELAGLPKSDAATLVSTGLTTALAEYQQVFDDYVETNGDYFRVGKEVQAGPSFTVGNVGTDTPTLMGARFRVLTLVFLAGNLKLEEAGPAVLHVADVAREQFLEWSQEEDYSLIFNYDLLARAGLCSRHVLGVGLLGTRGDALQEDDLFSKYKNRIQRHRLTRFDAIVTKYDTYARVGAAEVDDSDGITLWTVSPLSDDELAEIVEARSKRP